MELQLFRKLLVVLVIALGVTGCASTKPYDYTNFREHPPRSIMVLPPLNESTTIEGTYSYLSTVTRPLAERGYYVFPVAVIDEMFKENGMPTSGEMHEAPLSKIREIVGADAVMYITLKEYGTNFQLVESVPTVHAVARLVDTRTGVQLWDGEVRLTQSNGRSSGNILADIVAAAVLQAVNSTVDQAHTLCAPANVTLFANEERGLLPGPYRPSETAVSQ